MHRLLFSARLFFCGLALSCLASAQERVGTIQVLVAPDHPDWRYTPGEKVTFSIRAVRDGAPAPNVKLTYSIGPEMLEPTLTRTVTLGPEGLTVDGGTMNQPGFLRLIATVSEAGREYRGLATAGFSPEKLQPVTADPQDFDAFWNEGKRALAKVPIDAERTLLPAQSTGAVNVYEVSFRNVGAGANGTSRIFGILAIPKAPGKYPALLRVPGAGVYPGSPLLEPAEKGAITLSIGIHGIPLTLDPKVYTLLGSGALSGYWNYRLESRDQYYYRRVYLGCVRANDYLTSLPEWDGKTLAVMGGSQGGALSIVTAALDPRVKALAASYPALSDLAGYTQNRAGGWPHMFKEAANRTPEKLSTAAYYDVVNFARRIKVPGLYIWGYNDEVCPPTTSYAVYNVITAPKQLLLALKTGHESIPEESDRIFAWLDEHLRAPDPQRESRLRWWREARFGMFIHWGLYSEAAGEWNGKPVPGIGEWIMSNAKIPNAEYASLAPKFNPVKFDATQWVQLAKDAGMKYIVITSKHHDGFAMYRSKVSPYNIVDQTPFHRDPIAELAAACKKAGIRLCFYYSHVLDWHEPEAVGNTWDFGDDAKKDFTKYFDSKAKPQVRELLTNYGPIGLIWFDVWFDSLMTPSQARDMANLVHGLQPDCLINGRLGYHLGDYSSSDDNELRFNPGDRDWEAPATLNDTWGYKKDDHNWKSATALIRNLASVVSQGGNYLLNVGPTAEGVIPAASVERLHEVGAWMRRNEESIRGAGRAPLAHTFDWGVVTARPGRLYLHVFEWPKDKLVLDGLSNQVRTARLLSGGAPVTFTQQESKLTLNLPGAAPDASDSVIVLETN